MNVELIIATIPTKSAEERAKLRANAERFQASDDITKSDAGQAVLEALDKFDADQKSEIARHFSNLSIPDRVKEAFERMPLTETEARVLQVLADNPGSSSTALSEKLGWGGQTWHMHFGTLNKEREHMLWPAEEAASRPSKFWSGIIAEYDENTGWTLKSDVETTLRLIGALKQKPMTPQSA